MKRIDGIESIMLQDADVAGKARNSISAGCTETDHLDFNRRGGRELNVNHIWE